MYGVVVLCMLAASKHGKATGQGKGWLVCGGWSDPEKIRDVVLAVSFLSSLSRQITGCWLLAAAASPCPLSPSTGPR